MPVCAEEVSVASPVDLRRLFSGLPAPVVAICATLDDGPASFVASTCVPVSLDPPLLSVCVQNGSSVWSRLRDRPRLGLSVLAATHGDLARRLASRDPDKFTGVGLVPGADGDLYVAGAVAEISCRVARTVPAGDHEVVLLELAAARRSDGEPLVFHGSGFRRLVPGHLTPAEWEPLAEWQ